MVWACCSSATSLPASKGRSMPYSSPRGLRCFLLPHILSHSANRLDADRRSRRKAQGSRSRFSPLSEIAAADVRRLSGEAVCCHLFPRRCRAMLAEHLPPHSPNFGQPTGSLDGEQVFTHRPLLLAGESHAVHRSTAFRTRGPPAEIHSANSLRRHLTAPPRRTGAGARPLPTYRHQLRFATPAISADSEAVSSSRRCCNLASALTSHLHPPRRRCCPCGR